MTKNIYPVNPLEIKLKEYINTLTIEKWDSLFDALTTYYRTGIISIIPFSNFRFLVEFGLLEEDHKSKLKEILDILEYRF